MIKELPQHLAELDDKIHVLRHRLSEAEAGSDEEREILVELRMLRVRYDQDPAEQARQRAVDAADARGAYRRDR